jgi:hypothetical protein
MLSITLTRHSVVIRDTLALWYGSKPIRKYNRITRSSYNRLIALICDADYKSKTVKGNVRKYSGVRITK